MSMPRSLHSHLDKIICVFNKNIAEGLAVSHLKRVEDYIDAVFRSFALTAPPGLTYIGCRRCTPDEAYNLQAKKQGSRSTFDVAQSYIYLMRYDFGYEGHVITRYLQLPYVGKGGMLFMGGGRFGITPILADRVLSIDEDFIFLRLLMAKLTVKRESKVYMAGGEVEDVYVAWSRIYNTQSRDSKPTPRKPKCTLVHYLFCKYGFEETFRCFGKETPNDRGCTPIVGDDKTITMELYPPDQWVICESRKKAPLFLQRTFYEPSLIRLAIRKEEYTPMVRNLVAGFYYVVDLYPRRMQAPWVKEIGQWRILLGNIIWPGDHNHGHLARDVDDHLNSLDGYLDALNKDKLAVIGLPCDNVYELFGVTIKNINEWLLGPIDRVSTMYDKELQILYYVCMQITEAICKLGFKLQAAQKKPLDRKKITTFMNLHLKKGIIFGITHEHGEVTSQSTPGDNMALKITAQLVPQSKSTMKKGQHSRSVATDSALRLHASIAEVGGYANLPKNEPTGRSRINPTLMVSSTGLVLRKEKYLVLLDKVQDTITRKTDSRRLDEIDLNELIDPDELKEARRENQNEDTEDADEIDSELESESDD